MKKTILVLFTLITIACAKTTAPATITPSPTMPAPAATATAAPECAQAITDLYIRNDASERATVLNFITEGETVQVLANIGAWTLVHYQIWTGFAKADYLKDCQ